MDSQQHTTMPSAIAVGLRNCCPRCGEGRLFSGLLTPAQGCERCGLDYSFIDSGDGPAVFVILIVGFIVTAFALALQTAANPPLWLHLLLWVPIVIALSLWGLRISKAILIALQFRTAAQEGKLEG